MVQLVTTLHMALPGSGADGSPPMWLHLLPPGTFQGRDGRGPFKVGSAAAVIAASMLVGSDGQPKGIVLDENHATDSQLLGNRAPAMGWIVAMEDRGADPATGGIWGRVEWTADGIEMHARRSYRDISPVFQSDDKTGEVSRILRAGLTNNPNLTLTSIHNSQGAGMDFIPQLRQALGLADTADEAAILAATTALRTTVSAHSQQLGAIATAAGLNPTLSSDALVVALQTRGTGASDAKVVELQTQVMAMQTERSRERATIAIDAAMRAGKPITPALRDDFISRHAADPVGFQKLIDGMPSINSGGWGNRAPEPGESGHGMDAGDAAVCAQMGLDPVKFKAAKALLPGAGA